MIYNERIIENVNATMSMEDMPLIQEDRELAASCLEGKIEFGEAIASLVKRHAQKPVVRLTGRCGMKEMAAAVYMMTGGF